MYHFEKPIPKRDAYYAAIRSAATQQPITVKLAGCTVQALQSASGGKGHLFKILLPADVDSVLADLDRACRQAVLDNNATWFANTLTTEEIDAFYRPAITVQAGKTLLTAIALFSQPPEIICCGESVPSVTNLADMDVSAYVATVTLVAQGLFFYPTRFGLRWLVQHIALAKVDDDLEDEVDAHRADIESHWSATTAKALARMDADIRQYESKIAAIRRLQEDLRTLLAKARDLPRAHSSWNTTLETLASQISAYDTGHRN